MTGRLMNETLGKLHFWISLIAAYGTFFPMHFAGLAGEPRHYSQLTGTATSFSGLIPVERGITYAALFLAAAQLIFLCKSFCSALRGTHRSAQSLAGHHARVGSELAHSTINIGPYDYDIAIKAKRSFIRSGSHRNGLTCLIALS